MKTKSYFIHVLCACFVSLQSLFAQEVLTLSDALKLALENNYSILIAKNEAEISKNNNRIGAAGMLPSVVGTINQDNQIQDSRQKFLNGTDNNKDGAKNNSLNANVELGWTIFDGMKMFATKNRLNELQQIGELKMRANIENTFMRITKAYFDVLLAKQQLLSNEEALATTKQRRELAEDKWKAGKSPKTEVLKAKVDENADSATYLRQLIAVNNLKVTLNQLLARDINTSFEIDTNSSAIQKQYVLNELMNKVTAQNASLLIAKKNQQISLLSLREIQAERMPTIQLKSGYNYNKQQSEAGFLQSSQTNGFHFGAGLSINLFNGFDVSKRMQNAKLTTRSYELVYKDSLTRMQNQIQLAYNNFVLSQKLVEFEKQNLSISKENFEIANEQYKVGVITSIELREAQLNLLKSKIRLYSSEYEAKINETELLRLSGELMRF